MVVCLVITILGTKSYANNYYFKDLGVTILQNVLFFILFLLTIFIKYNHKSLKCVINILISIRHFQSRIKITNHLKLFARPIQNTICPYALKIENNFY